jgi:hypothetical protein
MPWLSCIASNVLLASVLALAARFTQRRLQRPALARMLWVLVLAKLLTPPLVSLPLGELPGRLACAVGTCGCGRHAGGLTVLSNMLPWALLAAWSIGAGATGWTAWRRFSHFRRLLGHAVAAPPEWQSLAARLSARLCLRRPPDLLVVPCRLPPLVVAGRRGPRVLLPATLLEAGRLDDAQREALLLHELVHIQRLDHLVRLLELAVGIVYWWLPVTFSIARQLRDCEEACCDAAVVDHLPQARREYARLLLDVLDLVAPLPSRAIPQATAMSAVHDLERRLRSILDTRPKPRPRWPAGVLAVGLACAVLPCGLHYEFVPAPAVRIPQSDGCEPAAGPMSVDVGCPGTLDLSATLCCPS